MFLDNYYASLNQVTSKSPKKRMKLAHYVFSSEPLYLPYLLEISINDLKKKMCLSFFRRFLYFFLVFIHIFIQWSIVLAWKRIDKFIFFLICVLLLSNNFYALIFEAELQYHSFFKTRFWILTNLRDIFHIFLMLMSS